MIPNKKYIFFIPILLHFVLSYLLINKIIYKNMDSIEPLNDIIMNNTPNLCKFNKIVSGIVVLFIIPLIYDKNRLKTIPYFLIYFYWY